jgi:hypothetical protein
MFTVKSSMQAAKLLVQRAATATTTTTTRSFAIVAQRDDWDIARNEAILRSIEEVS